MLSPVDPNRNACRQKSCSGSLTTSPGNTATKNASILYQQAALVSEPPAGAAGRRGSRSGTNARYSVVSPAMA